MLNEQKLKVAIAKYRKHVLDNLMVTTGQIEQEGWSFSDVLAALGDTEGATAIAKPQEMAASKVVPAPLEVLPPPIVLPPTKTPLSEPVR